MNANTSKIIEVRGFNESEFDDYLTNIVEQAIIKRFPKNDNNKKLLTRKEAAEKYGVSYSTLNEWRKKGHLIPKKIGGRIYYKADIDKL